MILTSKWLLLDSKNVRRDYMAVEIFTFNFINNRAAANFTAATAVEVQGHLLYTAKLSDSLSSQWSAKESARSLMVGDV